MSVAFAVPETSTCIYALVHPETYELRYIGKTRDPEARLMSHCRTKTRTHVSRWAQGLKRYGLTPKMVIIETGLSEEQWPEREQHWIAHYRGLGADLTNITDGGHHVVRSRRLGYAAIGGEFALKLATDKTLHGSEYRLYLFLFSRMDYEGRAYPSQTAIVDALGMTKSQVSVAVRRLVESKAIAKIRKDGVNGYEVHSSLATRGSLKK